MYSTDPMLPYYYIANYILAVIAIVSLFLSIRSSKKVSEELKFLKNGLIHYTEPIIKMTDYAWVKKGREELSITNLPTGIQTIITNVSTVPAQITKKVLKVFYGQLELSEIIMEYGMSNKIIFGVNESMTLMNIQENKFREHIKETHRFFQEPSLSVEINIEYSDLRGEKKFNYHTKQIIQFDPRVPEQKLATTIEENIEYL